MGVAVVRVRIVHASIVFAACALTACSGVSAVPTVASGPPTTTVTVPQTVKPEPATVTVTVTSSQLVNPAKVFDQEQLQQGVGNVLTARPPSGYGLTGVTNVSCPELQPIAAGTSFKCSLNIDGQATTVTVVIKNDQGLYEVNPPS